MNERQDTLTRYLHGKSLEKYLDICPNQIDEATRFDAVETMVVSLNAFSEVLHVCPFEGSGADHNETIEILVHGLIINLLLIQLESRMHVQLKMLKIYQKIQITRPGQHNTEQAEPAHAIQVSDR